MSVDEILLRSRYNPLKRILAYDVFNTGFNGWMTHLQKFPVLVAAARLKSLKREPEYLPRKPLETLHH